VTNFTIVEKIATRCPSQQDLARMGVELKFGWDDSATRIDRLTSSEAVVEGIESPPQMIPLALAGSGIPLAAELGGGSGHPRKTHQRGL
jgi:hypothetical protein